MSAHPIIDPPEPDATKVERERAYMRLLEVRDLLHEAGLGPLADPHIWALIKLIRSSGQLAGFARLMSGPWTGRPQA